MKLLCKGICYALSLCKVKVLLGFQNLHAGRVFKIRLKSDALPKTRINFLLTQIQKGWIRRSCAKWFYSISAMQETKVPSEIAYMNISKMCYLPTRRKNKNFAM